MPELNASIPPIECFVRGNFLRNQIDSHELKFPCVIFGVASIPDRAPVFHFLMEDGGVWWRAPINAFCSSVDSPEVDLHDLALWNSFSSHISVTVFEHMRGMSMSYIDRHKESVDGKYLFTLDWHSPDINVINANYSTNPGQHKCGHVIQRTDGNYAIQPNNRIRLWDPSYTTKKGESLIDRLINTKIWDVEDGDKWITSDDDRYDYDVVAQNQEITNIGSTDSTGSSGSSGLPDLEKPKPYDKGIEDLKRAYEKYSQY